MNIWLSFLKLNKGHHNGSTNNNVARANSCVCVCVCACSHAHALSHVQLFATPWTVARQAPLSMEFSRQEYRTGLPFPPPGDLPHWQAASLPLAPPGKPILHGAPYTYLKRNPSLCFLRKSQTITSLNWGGERFPNCISSLFCSGEVSMNFCSLSSIKAWPHTTPLLLTHYC